MNGRLLKSPLFLLISWIGLLSNSGCHNPNAKIVAHLPDPFLRSKRITPVPPLPTPKPLSRKVIPPIGRRYLAGLPYDVIPPGGIQKRWKYIVIHHSATRTGNAEQFNRDHLARGWDGLGYHFVIGNGRGSPDGFIETGYRWRKQMHGAHCKTPDNRYNDFGIGICLVGDFEHGGYPTLGQLEALRKLVLFLIDECHIPLSNIKTHRDITHKTACPGWNFSLSAFIKRLAALAVR